MSKRNWIKAFAPLDWQRLLQTAAESVNWIEQYGHVDGDVESWDVMPGKQVEKDALLLDDASLYAGAAGIALLYLKYYVATEQEKYLRKAEAGIRYVIRKYRGKEDFATEVPFLQGAYIGYLNGPAGGAYVAKELYKITGEERYKQFALTVADDAIEAAKDEQGALTWYGFYGILGEGGLILFLLDVYNTFGGDKYLDAAVKAAKYIADHKEDAPQGGYRWYVMDTETFPTIGKAGGYFPGFEYGAAGCGYILASVYEQTHQEEYLDIAKKAAQYIQNIADYSEDGEAALVKYNDTYLTDLYYLGVCQGPIGTSRLFYKLYRITGDESYKDFVIKLTNGLLAAGAPTKHSDGYWRTNCYCCGAAGMLEHFLHVHKLTGNSVYLDAAYEAAEAIIGESTYQHKVRNWYTSWNRHEPDRSEAYVGLYHGSGGCAASLLALAQYIEDKTYLPGYLEDPYQDLYVS